MSDDDIETLEMHEEQMSYPTFETQIFLFWFTNLKVILHRLHERSQDLPLVSCIVTLSNKDTDVWCKFICNNIKGRML